MENGKKTMKKGQQKTIIEIVCMVCLVFFLFVTIGSYRGCEILDAHSNEIRTVNCLEIKRD